MKLIRTSDLIAFIVAGMVAIFFFYVVGYLVGIVAVADRERAMIGCVREGGTRVDCDAIRRL